jgi:tRNA threonylcarbamoyladenosine modification (KEOPS) complex Cgi121 subunit
MTKFALFMYLCAAAPSLECKLIQTEFNSFIDEYECVHYGYKKSLELIEKFGREDVNKLSLYTKFVCTAYTEETI